MATHTPGPWEVVGICRIVNAAGDSIALTAGDASSLDGPTNIANACLIAAAPDLLAALLRARGYVEEYACGKLTTNLKAINDAIDKAEGKLRKR